MADPISSDCSTELTPRKDGDIWNIGTPNGEATASEGYVALSAKAGQGRNVSSVSGKGENPYPLVK